MEVDVPKLTINFNGLNEFEALLKELFPFKHIDFQEVYKFLRFTLMTNGYRNAIRDDC